MTFPNWRERTRRYRLVILFLLLAGVAWAYSVEKMASERTNRITEYLFGILPESQEESGPNPEDVRLELKNRFELEMQHLEDRDTGTIPGLANNYEITLFYESKGGVLGLKRCVMAPTPRFEFQNLLPVRSDGTLSEDFDWVLILFVEIAVAFWAYRYWGARLQETRSADAGTEKQA